MLPILVAAATTAMLPAAAQDLRCMVASEFLMVRTPPGVLQQQAQMMIMYFLGRVEAEIPENDLPARMSETLKPPQSALNNDLPRCIHELQNAGDRLKALGARLKAEGK